jgi:hypothetical protein
MKTRYKQFFEDSSINQVMKEITEIFKENKIDFCFIGGNVLRSYGYNRATNDIDILINYDDKEKFKELIGRYLSKAFSGSLKTFNWKNPKVRVEIIYSGEEAGSKLSGVTYHEPYKLSQIKNGFPVLRLEYLVMYKIASGIHGNRLKDLGDVQELIKINKLKREFAKLFRRDLRNKYLEIWDMTNLNENYKKAWNE